MFKQIISYDGLYRHMSNDKLEKKIYCDVTTLGDQGFTTWETDALRLVKGYRLDVTFAIKCRHVVESNYIASWFASLQDIQWNPILMTYKSIKFEYSMAPYLYPVKKSLHLHSTVKSRCSSHIFEIERGRKTSLKTPLTNRKCLVCDENEDERYFVLEFIVNKAERELFFE